MNIQVNENWKLTSDPANFIVEKKFIAGEKAKTPGEVTWKPMGFYTDIDKALAGLLRQTLLESEATSLSELRRSIQGVYDCVEEVRENLTLTKIKE